MVLRIFIMIATRGFLTDLECTEFVFSRGSAPGPHWGSLQRSPRSPSWFKGPTSKGKEREARGKERRRGKEGDGRDSPPLQIPKSAPGPTAQRETSQVAVS